MRYRNRFIALLAGAIISTILMGVPTMKTEALSSQSVNDNHLERGFTILESETSRENDFKTVAYYPNWYGDFTTSVQWDKLTHVNYAFALPNRNGTIDSVKGSEKIITSLITAAHENDVKVCLAVGGWSYSDGSQCSTVFESATDTDEKCRTLADSILELVDEYGFDGVDMDWEYPTANSAKQYTTFMGYLKEGLAEREKLFTAAVQATGGTHQTDEVLAMLDWINVMAYDGNAGSGHSPYSYMVKGFEYWNGSRGVPAEKVVLGVPFYERPTWAAYASIVKADPENAYKDSAVINGTTVHYNGLDTMADKAEYAVRNAGGIMIWEISQDSKDEEISLLNAIYDTVNGGACKEKSVVLYLEEVTTVGRVVLNWGETYGNYYIVQTSIDGQYWSTAKVVTEQKGGCDTVVFNPMEAVYVRVLSSAGEPVEIRIFGV